MGFDGFLQRDHQTPAAAPAIPARRLDRSRPRPPAQLRRPDPRRAMPEREAAVLAHDLNNLLNVILMTGEAVALNLPEGSEARELAEASQDAAIRAAELVRRLRDLGVAPADAGCDAADAVASTARMASLSAPAGVVVETDIAAARLACKADRGGLDSALLNLCVNAGHAMPAGGVLSLSAERRGGEIVITVTDTGCGMSAEVLAQATEFHFTTRRARGGSGLGLAGVADFARASGGRFELASVEGRGTTATLTLPRA